MSFDFQQLELPGLVLVRPKRFEDSRGYFCESYRKSEFAAHGIGEEFVQDNHSSSIGGVVRGLHYQVQHAAQAKLVRTVVGRVFDVAVDVRKNSATFGRWQALPADRILGLAALLRGRALCLGTSLHFLVKLLEFFHRFLRLLEIQ